MLDVASYFDRHFSCCVSGAVNGSKSADMHRTPLRCVPVFFHTYQVSVDQDKAQTDRAKRKVTRKALNVNCREMRVKMESRIIRSFLANKQVIRK